MLQKLEAQYTFNAYRRTVITWLGLRAFNNLRQLYPKYHTVHFREKCFLSGRFPIAFKITRSKDVLFHHYQPVPGNAGITANFALDQSLSK